MFLSPINFIQFGVQVKTFPNGIKEAFGSLMKTLGSDRDYYGISWMDENDQVKYYAMAREVSPGEGEQYNYEALAIEKGEYQTEAIRDWMRKTDCIKDVFHKLTAGIRPDKEHPCIEWYQSDDEMLCMIKTMTTETVNIDELISAIGSAVAQLTDLLSSVENDKVNTVPYEGSWTAPQLIRHVTKSIAGMANAMKAPAKPADRDPAERIPQLKNVFLDFSQKLQAPEFIVPESGTYEKESTIAGLNKAFHDFRENTKNAKLNELVEGLPLGPITKLEITHFVLYHTQRHLHQMQKICAALAQK